MSRNRPERLAAYRASQKRYRPNRRQFEELVVRALEDLPEEFRARLSNVAVMVEERPRVDQIKDRDSLLGLYEGTPLASRGADYHLALPDRITIYRGPILELCDTREDVLREVRETVIHEIGHFFGLDDHELP